MSGHFRSVGTVTAASSETIYPFQLILTVNKKINEQTKKEEKEYFLSLATGTVNGMFPSINGVSMSENFEVYEKIKIQDQDLPTGDGSIGALRVWLKCEKKVQGGILLDPEYFKSISVEIGRPTIRNWVPVPGSTIPNDRQPGPEINVNIPPNSINYAYVELGSVYYDSGELDPDLEKIKTISLWRCNIWHSVAYIGLANITDNTAIVGGEKFPYQDTFWEI